MVSGYLLISEAKTGLSALALKRQLGVSYETAWLVRHTLMQAMLKREEITNWALNNVSPGGKVLSDGLPCFTGVEAAGYQHEPLIASSKKLKDLPLFLWIITTLGNVKTSLSDAHHAFSFGKYAARYLEAISYRFNRRFRLGTLPLTGRGNDLRATYRTPATQES